MAKPNAKKAALRSSRRTWTRRRSARGSASGVEREPGQIDRIGDAEPGPLVDEGGAEGGLYAHPACHSMSTCAARGRRSSCCTGSRRPGASGAASGISWPNAARWSPWISPGTATRGLCGPTCRPRPSSWPRPCGPPWATDPCALLGYSLGARVALHVATGTDLALGAAVLIGATAGIADPAERERRRRSDDVLADELEASGDVEGFLDAWLRGPMFERLAQSNAAWRAERLRNSASGLASSLRLCGAGTQEPLWDLLPGSPAPSWRWRGPTTRASRRTRSESPVWRRGPSPRSFPVGGHAVHLAQPEQAGRIVRHWLDAVEPGSMGPPS